MSGEVPPAAISARRPRVVRRRGQLVLAALLMALCAVVAGAIVTIAWLFVEPAQDDPAASTGRSVAQQQQVAAAQTVPPPPVEPVEYLPVSRDDARAINARVPFSTDPNPAARPLTLTLSPESAARAVDCLAAAAWYEAGDDAAGEQAVVQVVLNRMRHPAFPKTVCGVVFQGSERSTGCQFSFTCDGAMARTPSAAAWQRARNAAVAGINGLVFAGVGQATHYHTDWVVPNWSSSVDKITAVGTHLFFRWRGGNGRPGAFRSVHAGAEPLVPGMARLSPAHRPGFVAGVPEDGAMPADAAAAPVLVPTLPTDAGVAQLRGNALRRRDNSTNVSVIAIKPGQFSGTLALVALDMCKASGDGACTVVGFLGTPGRVEQVPGGSVRWPDRAPDFYYFRDPRRGRETSLWNCTALPRPDPAQCMPRGFTPG